MLDLKSVHHLVFFAYFLFLQPSQIDTKDILFICGGAFIDLEKTISERLSHPDIANMLSFVVFLIYLECLFLFWFPTDAKIRLLGLVLQLGQT